MTNAEMAAAVEILGTLNETGKLGYAIARNLRLLKTEATEYLNLRSELFRKYGTINGTQATVEKDNIEAFTEEMGDIPNIEHDVDLFKVDEETFTSGGLTSKQMEALLWMIEEES